MTDQIARTILQQLGGNRFVAMTGAQNILDAGDGPRLDFRGCRAYNRLGIFLAADDTYTVRFIKRAGPAKLYETLKVVEYKGIYADGLRELFERVTGLATAL